MTRATALILLLVGIIFAIGIHNVYGETFEDVISFPIPDNITGQEKRGTLITLTDDLLEMQFTYRFHLGQNGTEWFEEIIKELGLTPPDVTLCPDNFYLDEDGVTCYPIIDEPELPLLTTDLTPPTFKGFVADFKKFEEKNPEATSEKDYHALLKSLQMCYRQSEENQQSLGVTQTDGFVVSATMIDDFGIFLKSYDLTGRHSLLEKAIEECKYIHTILNPVTLGPEYQNRAIYYNTTQLYHGDVAADVPTWSQERVNIESNDRTEIRDGNPICAMGSYYSDQTKRMYCGDDYTRPAEDALTEERTQDMCNSMFVNKDFKIRNGCSPQQIQIPCYSCGTSSPVIESEAYRKYADFRNNGDEAQWDLLKRQKYQEAMTKLWQEIRDQIP